MSQWQHAISKSGHYNLYIYNIELLKTQEKRQFNFKINVKKQKKLLLIALWLWTNAQEQNSVQCYTVNIGR